MLECASPMTSDISDQVIEAILGPDLTRKLDNYLARDEGGERYTRLEAVQVASAPILRLRGWDSSNIGPSNRRLARSAH